VRYHDIDVRQHRAAEHGVDPIFIERWSPRAMSGEPVARETLMAMFEAAHWAPGSGNNQPWRFLYALRDTEHWPTFLDLLNERNRAWAHRAGALVLFVSKMTFDRTGAPSRTHSFDTGAAWMSFALQGMFLGLVVHGMEGFDYDRARQVLGVPDEHDVEAIAAVGWPGDTAELPEYQRPREIPSTRKPFADIVFEGTFPAR